MGISKYVVRLKT